jgi:hypothetical protein
MATITLGSVCLAACLTSNRNRQAFFLFLFSFSTGNNYQYYRTRAQIFT